MRLATNRVGTTLADAVLNAHVQGDTKAPEAGDSLTGSPTSTHPSSYEALQQAACYSNIDEPLVRSDHGTAGLTESHAINSYVEEQPLSQPSVTTSSPRSQVLFADHTSLQSSAPPQALADTAPKCAFAPFGVGLGHGGAKADASQAGSCTEASIEHATSPYENLGVGSSDSSAQPDSQPLKPVALYHQYSQKQEAHHQQLQYHQLQQQNLLQVPRSFYHAASAGTALDHAAGQSRMMLGARSATITSSMPFTDRNELHASAYGGIVVASNGAPISTASGATYGFGPSYTTYSQQGSCASSSHSQVYSGVPTVDGHHRFPSSSMSAGGAGTASAPATGPIYSAPSQRAWMSPWQMQYPAGSTSYGQLSTSGALSTQSGNEALPMRSSTWADSRSTSLSSSQVATGTESGAKLAEPMGASSRPMQGAEPSETPDQAFQSPTRPSTSSLTASSGARSRSMDDMNYNYMFSMPPPNGQAYPPLYSNSYGPSLLLSSYPGPLVPSRSFESPFAYRPDLSMRPTRSYTSPPAPLPKVSELRVEVSEENGKRRLWYRAPNGQFASASSIARKRECLMNGVEPPSSRRIRKRRKGEEIERNYICDFQGCRKAYGTLNHLNTHRIANDHGPRLNAAAYRELRPTAGPS